MKTSTIIAGIGASLVPVIEARAAITHPQFGTFRVATHDDIGRAREIYKTCCSVPVADAETLTLHHQATCAVLKQGDAALFQRLWDKSLSKRAVVLEKGGQVYAVVGMVGDEMRDGYGRVAMTGMILFDPAVLGDKTAKAMWWMFLQIALVLQQQGYNAAGATSEKKMDDFFGVAKAYRFEQTGYRVSMNKQTGEIVRTPVEGIYRYVAKLSDLIPALTAKVARG